MRNQLVILSLAFLLLCPMASAKEPAFVATGSYGFSGEINLLQAKRTVIVRRASSAQGRERIRLLRSEGFACQVAVEDSFSCKRFLRELSTVPDEISSRLRAKYGALVFDFGRETASPELRAEGERYREWVIHQSVAQGNNTYRRSVLQELPELLKVVLEDESGHLDWSFVADPKSRALLLVLETQRQESNGWTSYLVGVDFRTHSFIVP